MHDQNWWRRSSAARARSDKLRPRRRRRPDLRSKRACRSSVEAATRRRFPPRSSTASSARRRKAREAAAGDVGQGARWRISSSPTSSSRSSPAAFAVIVKQHPARRPQGARYACSRGPSSSTSASARSSRTPTRPISRRCSSTIAEQLDGSPVFAQLVDEVTEGARKITSG